MPIHRRGMSGKMPEVISSELDANTIGPEPVSRPTIARGKRGAHMATESHAVASESHAAAGHADHGGVPYLHHHFDDMEQQRECTYLVMWAFLCTEAMMFGGLFFAYTLYRWIY